MFLSGWFFLQGWEISEWHAPAHCWQLHSVSMSLDTCTGTVTKNKECLYKMWANNSNPNLERALLVAGEVFPHSPDIWCILAIFYKHITLTELRLWRKDVFFKKTQVHSGTCWFTSWKLFRLLLEERTLVSFPGICICFYHWGQDDRVEENRTLSGAESSTLKPELTSGLGFPFCWMTLWKCLNLPGSDS